MLNSINSNWLRVKVLENQTERSIEEVHKLIDILHRFHDGLVAQDPSVREKETLENVAPLSAAIKTSAESLSGATRQQAFQLLEKIDPLFEYSTVYESTASILRCIERSINLLREASPSDELVSVLERTYASFKDAVISSSSRNAVRTLSYVQGKGLERLALSLLNELTGDLLEKFYLPKLVEEMGYQLKSRTVPTSIGEVEVDIRAEKDKLIGFEKLEKHTEKRVLIIEAKTTINSEDISKFSKKSKAIIENYQKDAAIWKYALHLETWIVACYGWNDDLKELAANVNILPIDTDKLENMLQEYSLLHKGRVPWRKRQ